MFYDIPANKRALSLFCFHVGTASKTIGQHCIIMIIYMCIQSYGIMRNFRLVKVNYLVYYQDYVKIMRNFRFIKVNYLVYYQDYVKMFCCIKLLLIFNSY